MKILLTFFVLFFSPLVVAEVYYCVENAATGFDGDNEFIQDEFEEIRFTADIDFQKLFLKSEDIYINTLYDSNTCINDFENKYMQCINGFGTSFSINKKNLKFVYATGLGYLIGSDQGNDDLILSYGQCSLF